MASPKMSMTQQGLNIETRITPAKRKANDELDKESSIPKNFTLQVAF
jgi:hypothetical protein